MQAYQSAGFAYQTPAYQDNAGALRAFQTALFAYQAAGQFAYQDTAGVAPTGGIVDWIIRARRHCIR